MKRIPILLLAFLVSLVARAATPIELPVWPGIAPGSEGHNEKEVWEERGKNGVVNRAVRQVHTPTLSVVLPEKTNATGAAILIAPGGSYDHVTIDLEGFDVARWLAAQGIAGIVLKYRLPQMPEKIYTIDDTLADAVQALKVVRAHAAEWGIDPAKVGMMGFSAGGNLTALAGTKPPKEDRPAFLAPIYPFNITDSFGPVPDDVAPIFLAQASDDRFGPENAIRLYTWAHAKRAPAELHLFASGGHGFGLGRPGTPAAEWPTLFLAWLKNRKIIPSN
ncbi:MAG TPA: alpha/beta hydrolase [Opitutaceae bacterium]|nr:alpha/beta hydrolase [Opitutaceae bacterium]